MQLTEKEREYKQIFSEMVVFLRSLGLVVHTNTKARGHQGFFLKNRIDISNNICFKRKIEVLIHEFTHYIHYKIDSQIGKTHGNLEILFPNADIKRIENELFSVTKAFDNNKSTSLLQNQRSKVIEEIKELDRQIKSYYPDFKRSYPYKPFERTIKKTDAKYLLKYDRVKVKTVFLGQTKLYTIKTIDEDFPSLDIQTKNYIRLKSKQRALKRISSRINRINSYYKRPTELFARFVEALFIDTEKVSQIAPHSYLVFCSELSKNKYLELADFINKFF